MPEVSMKNMMSAGVHFGHQTHRWNPKMAPFIFGPRNGIHIIDLEQTVNFASKACEVIKKISSSGGKVLFVATKRQAKMTAKEAALDVGMPYVVERWLGGTLTNFSTIRRSVDKLLELEKMSQDGTYDLLPKKETVMLERKRKKLESSLGGLRDLKALPAALFVIDPETEKIAVREANRLNIPVIALVDTNCNPDPIDHLIPGNDDAIKSVSLFVGLIAESCKEGAAVYEQKLRSQPQHQKKKEQEEVKGPIVEKVVKQKLKLPSEIDYHDDFSDIEEVEKEHEKEIKEVAAKMGVEVPEEGEEVPKMAVGPDDSSEKPPEDK